MSPARLLRPYVTEVIAYDQDLGAPGVHRGLPSTRLTLVLPADAPLRVSWGEAEAATVGWTSLAGLHTRPAAIHHDGHQRGVMLSLTPAGARALFGMPAAALAGELVRLDEVAPELSTLPERLAETDPAGHPGLVAEALAASVARRDALRMRAEVGRALALLTRGAAVEGVAGDVGLSRRRLRDLVSAECGVSPATFRRLARFERARHLLGHGPLAQAALRAGYADQAHLSREWRSMAGCTPTTWLREEFPFVQDGAEVAGGD